MKSACVDRSTPSADYLSAVFRRLALLRCTRISILVTRFMRSRRIGKRRQKLAGQWREQLALKLRVAYIRDMRRGDTIWLRS